MKSIEYLKSTFPPLPDHFNLANGLAGIRFPAKYRGTKTVISGNEVQAYALILTLIYPKQDRVFMIKLFLIGALCVFSMAVFEQAANTFSPGPPGGMTPASPPGYVPPTVATPVPPGYVPPVGATPAPVTTPASPATPTVNNPAPTGQTFAEHKNTALQGVSTRLIALQNEENCINAAATDAALQACGAQ